MLVLLVKDFRERDREREVAAIKWTSLIAEAEKVDVSAGGRERVIAAVAS
jgi:hypothetical protein